MRLTISMGGDKFDLQLKPIGSGWLCLVNGKEVSLDVNQISADHLSILTNGKSYQIRRGNGGEILVDDQAYGVDVNDARAWRGRQHHGSGESGPLKLTASMPGKVVRILATAGERVEKGQSLVVVEAMKMQNEVRSPREGVLKEMRCREGVRVNAGEVLAIID